MPDTYDTQEILEAIDHLDRLRQLFAEVKGVPCVLRDELMALHGEAMQGHAVEVVDTADSIAVSFDEARESIEFILDVMNRIESTPLEAGDEETLL